MTAAAAVHRVDAATCTGAVLDQGALVLGWAPTGAEPVLWSQSGLVVAQGRSPHAGVPVCWPWFGAGTRPGLSPAHGVVRAAPWRLVERHDEADAVTTVHRITSDDVATEHFPHAWALTLAASLGTTLRLSLTTENTGTDAFEVEEALHTYLAVGDVRQVRLAGLDGVSFWDKVTGAERTQAGDVTFAGETDRVYRADGPVEVVDPVLGRRLRVTTAGAANRVVWNPWADEAVTVDDIGDEWPHFVCVEGGNVLEQAVTVAPGESRTMTYEVEVLPL